MSKKLTLFALTWPIFIEIFLHMLMGNADTLMLSQYSDDAVAAVGVANQILSVVIVMFGFVATGAGILIAQLLGAKKGKEASEYVALALFINFLFGLFISVVLFLFGESILRMMKLPEELMDQSLQYLQIVGGLSFIESLILTIGAIVRCHGFTKDAMYVTMGMNVLNVIGNYLFIFGPFGLPVLGVTGVALSTAVSRAIGLVVMFMILWKRVEGQIPFQCLFPFPKKELGQLLKIGIPSAGEHLAYNSSQVVITYFISLIGTESLTTKIYAQNISMFIFLFAVAMGQGTQILIGHLIGAGKNEEAYNTCLRSLRIAMLISLGMASIFSSFREQLLGIFTDNPAVIALGSTLILLTIILEPGRTFNLVIINSLRAAGDVKFPVYMGILSMWGVGVTLSYLLGIHFGLGLIGVWIAFAADEWLRGLFMLWRWRSRVWEKMSFVNGKSQEGLGI